MALILTPAIVEDEVRPFAVGAVLKIVLSPVRRADGHLHVLEQACAAGQTVAAVLPRDMAWLRVIWNGTVLTADAQATTMLRPGDEVLVLPQWGTGLEWLWIPIVVGLAVSIATTALSYLLFPPAKPHVPQGLDEPTFSFAGIQTAIGPGNVVPVIYGRHRVGGQLLSAAVDQVITVLDDNSGTIRRVDALSAPPTLSMLLALGEGPMGAILTETIEINGQPIANFPTVQLYTRLGTPDQPPVVEFGETSNTFADGREIAGDPGIVYTTTQAVHAFTLNIAFQEGLYYLTDKGEKHENTSTLGYRYRVHPAGAWTDFSFFEPAAARTSVVRFGIRKEGLALATYDIHVQWSHARNVDELRAKWMATLDSVTELQHNTTAYPHTALLGLRSVATDALQGALPNITVEVQGRTVRVGTFALGETWTDNPAWCVMDMLTHPRYGLGYSDATIDLPAFLVWAQYNDQLIDGEPRHTLNYVLDREQRGQPLLLEMCGGSRTLLVKSEGLWSPRVTRDDAPVQLFSWANVSNLKLTYTRDPDDINVMEGRFSNEEEGFEQDVLTWPTVDTWPADVRKASLDLRGVTKPSRVTRALQFELNRRRLESLSLEMDCATDAVVLQIHDVFRFAHPLPGWGISGRLQPLSGTSVLHLDEPITITEFAAYHVYVRHADDTIEVKDVVFPGFTTVTSLTLVTPLGITPVPYTSLWAFGKGTPETAVKLFRVTAMQRKSDTTVHIRAVAHHPGIYDEPTAAPLPPITTLFNPLGPSPPITSLVLMEIVRVEPNGNSLRVVNLSWDVAPLSQGYGPYGGATILRRTVLQSSLSGTVTAGFTEAGTIQDPTDANVGFVPLVQLRGHVLDWDDFTILSGATYVYRVVPVSQRGVPNNVGARDAIIHVTGPTTPNFFPGTVSGLRLKGKALGDTIFEGRNVELEWDPLTGAVFNETFYVADYLIEVWAPGQLYLLRRTVVPARGPGQTIDFVYTLEQNTEDQLRAGQIGARRDLLFLVWARTNTNRVSLTPASITVFNPPPDMSMIIPEVTPLIASGQIEWDQFAEPRDFDHYEIHLDTINPPIAIYVDLSAAGFTGVGSSFRKVAPLNLIIGATYYVYILPYDTFGPGLPSHTVSFVPVSVDLESLDSTPPATPSGLTLITGTERSDDGTILPWVQANWAAGLEADLGGYEIQFRVLPNPVPSTFQVGPSTSARLGVVPGNSTVGVRIAAFDKIHNVSPYTAEVTITTAGDTSAPAPPTGLVAIGGTQNINLLWTPPGDPDYAYSEVWSSASSAWTGGSAVGQGSYSFTHGGLGPNEHRWYWLRSVDTSGNLSASFHPLHTLPGIEGIAGQLDTTFISSLAANKILTGVLQVLVGVGVSGNVFIDGVNHNIYIYDSQSPQVLRGLFGKLGPLSNAYGLQLFNALGQLMWNFTDGAQTEGIAERAIAGSKIRVGALQAEHLSASTLFITNVAQLATAVVGSAQIQDASIQAAHITTAAIQSAHIANAAIQTAHLALALIQTAHIVDAAVVNAKIGDAAITSAKIGTAQIQTAHIVDAAITNAKIGNLEVDFAKIANLTVGTQKIASGAVSESILYSSGTGGSTTGAAISIATITTNVVFGDAVLLSLNCTLTTIAGTGMTAALELRYDTVTGTLVNSIAQTDPGPAQIASLQGLYLPTGGATRTFHGVLTLIGGTGTVGVSNVTLIAQVLHK